MQVWQVCIKSDLELHAFGNWYWLTDRDAEAAVPRQHENREQPGELGFEHA